LHKEEKEERKERMKHRREYAKIESPCKERK
jgi:hypothetical protein